MKKKGKFITVEGIEGSGKSTLVKMLADRLLDLGEIPVITREPGGSGLGRMLRPILLDARREGLDRLAELHLFLADRAQHMEEEILPSLAQGKTVICDRFADSTVAYQAYGRQLDPEMVRKICLTHSRLPDLTLLLDTSPETGLARASKRNEKAGTTVSEGRFESEKPDFHARVREGFLEQARHYPDRIKIINASESPEAVLNSCLALIAKKFDNIAGWQV